MSHALGHVYPLPFLDCGLGNPERSSDFRVSAPAPFVDEFNTPALRLSSELTAQTTRYCESAIRRDGVLLVKLNESWVFAQWESVPYTYRQRTRVEQNCFDL